jgi:hypothetical protein
MPAPGRAPGPPSRPPNSSAATPSRTTRISPCPSTWCTSASRRGARRWGPDGRPSARLPPSSSPSPTRTRERPGTGFASTSTGPSRGSRGTWGRRADAPAPTFGGTPGGRAWRRARIQRSRGKIFPDRSGSRGFLVITGAATWGRATPKRTVRAGGTRRRRGPTPRPHLDWG